MKVYSPLSPSCLRRAFTLIELLTVIAIIGILAAILIPTVGAVRTKAAATKSASNLRQFGMALQQFTSEGRRITPTVAGDNGGPWDKQLAPYLGFQMQADGNFPKGAEALFFHPRDPSPEDTRCRRSYAMNHPAYVGNANLNSIPISKIGSPSQVMIFTERINGAAGGGNFAGSINSAGIAGPITDTVLDLNGKSHMYNYCFMDGHVETRRSTDPRMIGRGNNERPRGAWTIEEGD